jgi:hypothetical protein
LLIEQALNQQSAISNQQSAISNQQSQSRVVACNVRTITPRDSAIVNHQ